MQMFEMLAWQTTRLTSTPFSFLISSLSVAPLRADRDTPWTSATFRQQSILQLAPLGDRTAGILECCVLAGLSRYDESYCMCPTAWRSLGVCRFTNLQFCDVGSTIGNLKISFVVIEFITLSTFILTIFMRATDHNYPLENTRVYP
jgi:hypothetical protein